MQIKQCPHVEFIAQESILALDSLYDTKELEKMAAQAITFCGGKRRQPH
jgi:hypothetical protein